MIPTVTGSLK